MWWDSFLKIEGREEAEADADEEGSRGGCYTNNRTPDAMQRGLDEKKRGKSLDGQVNVIGWCVPLPPSTSRYPNARGVVVWGGVGGVCVCGGGSGGDCVWVG